MTAPRTRGRPQLRTDDEILDAALRAFAADGFEGMSVRALNAQLGLSHEAIGQRFGSKRDLYFTVVDRAIAAFFATMAAARAELAADLDDIDELRATIRSLLIAISRSPELGMIVNREGSVASDRLDHLVRQAFEPGVATLTALLARLTERAAIRPTSARTLFFLVQAAGAPFHAPKLSAAFDVIDGPLDPVPYVESITELIMRGIAR